MVGGHVGGAPAQLGGRGDGVGGDAVEIPNEAGVGGATGVEGLVGHRRLDPVAGARGGEGRAGELLGVESQRAEQRAVLPARERPRHRLRRQAVAQPRQIYVTLVTRSTIMHAMQAGLTDTEAAADQGKE
uniref:Uncharacterized protein n=1 Tax=Oryza meridionalis TaxID=40149 RepID=A0A0E0DVF0_9ORYZ